MNASRETLRKSFNSAYAWIYDKLEEALPLDTSHLSIVPRILSTLQKAHLEISKMADQVQSEMQSQSEKLSWTQMSLVGFIGFTVIQIVLFLFTPGLYALATPDLDYAPVYPAFRLIGMKEIGLMTTYATFVLANDARLFLMTCVGRLTVLPEFLILVFVIGAPVEFLGGIIQDLASLALTAVALSVERDKLRVPVFAKAKFEERLVRLLIAATGAIELAFGVMAFSLPTTYSNTPLIPNAWAQPPLNIGPRSVGMMSIALGGYQLCISWLRADQRVYAAVGFMNTSFYMLAKLLSFFLSRSFPGEKLHPMVVPFLLGVLTLALSIGADMKNIREMRGIPRKWVGEKKEN